MTIERNKSLLPYNTFGINAVADQYVAIQNKEDLTELLASGILRDRPFLILGGGSNLVFSDTFHGIVVHMCNKGIRQIASDDKCCLVEALAGEKWDAFVQHCIAQGWYGLENLTAIPGTVGASPVQNVGAYGMEAKDVVHEVHTYDVRTGEERVFANEECQFSYRNSIFKTTEKNHYIVWSVVYKLLPEFHPNMEYKALSTALQAQCISNPTAAQLSDVIAQVRWSKLPRPEEMGSAGSFFKNPVVPRAHYERLFSQYPDMVAYPVDGGYKLAAGWLIERAGWKGRTMGAAGVYAKQALVLVNRGAADSPCTGVSVIQLADAIVADVKQKFDVTLEKEAIII